MSTISERIRLARGNELQSNFAKTIDCNINTLRSYEKGQSNPNFEFMQSICSKSNISPEWLIFGTGSMYKDTNPVAHTFTDIDQDLVWIPMVKAVLSAGHGSLETSGESERKYAFRYDFIARKGNPDNMVLMRVAGDSMEPDILDGDTVLIDQSKTTIAQGKIFAVGFDEAIYLKKIDLLPGKVVLKSANPEYPPLELDTREQLAESFRIIGRVLWCGREYL